MRNKTVFAEQHRALLIAKNSAKDLEISRLKAKLFEFTQVHNHSVAAQRYHYERRCYQIVIAILSVIVLAFIWSLLYANICKQW